MSPRSKERYWLLLVVFLLLLSLLLLVVVLMLLLLSLLLLLLLSLSLSSSLSSSGNGFRICKNIKFAISNYWSSSYICVWLRDNQHIHGSTDKYSCTEYRTQDARKNDIRVLSFILTFFLPYILCHVSWRNRDCHTTLELSLGGQTRAALSIRNSDWLTSSFPARRKIKAQHESAVIFCYGCSLMLAKWRVDITF